MCQKHRKYLPIRQKLVLLSYVALRTPRMGGPMASWLVNGCLRILMRRQGIKQLDVHGFSSWMVTVHITPWNCWIMLELKTSLSSAIPLKER